MAAPKKKIVITEDVIISAYTDYCLTHGKKPNSVYEFAKQNGMTESDFYQFFTSFESLEKQYFVAMFDYSLTLLEKNEAYQSYESADKLSAFYFTFFEMATANRSFVIYLLEQDKVLQEASWLQFLSIFNFWMKDESKNFEKTDIFIEKSVKASFDLAYNIPTQSIIDFGKFLWKEQMNGMFSKS